jgi:hypothetical protein
MLRFAISISLILGWAFFAHSQPVQINADDVPLNKLLQEISTEHNLHISFDDELLSAYLVSMDQEYASPEEAIKHIIKPFPIILENVGGVLVIYQSTEPEEKPEQKSFRLSGQILESGTKEPLPYSHVTINGHAMATDLNGSFSFISQ